MYTITTRGAMIIVTLFCVLVVAHTDSEPSKKAKMAEPTTSNAVAPSLPQDQQQHAQLWAAYQQQWGGYNYGQQVNRPAICRPLVWRYKKQNPHKFLFPALSPTHQPSSASNKKLYCLQMKAYSQLAME